MGDTLTAQPRQFDQHSRLIFGVLALISTLADLFCIGTASQILGPESDSLIAQIVGASPSFTVFQYIEAIAVLPLGVGVLAFGSLALKGHFPRIRYLRGNPVGHGSLRR